MTIRQYLKTTITKSDFIIANLLRHNFQMPFTQPFTTNFTTLRISMTLECLPIDFDEISILTIYICFSSKVAFFHMSNVGTYLSKYYILTYVSRYVHLMSNAALNDFVMNVFFCLLWFAYVSKSPLGRWCFIGFLNS